MTFIQDFQKKYAKIYEDFKGDDNRVEQWSVNLFSQKALGVRAPDTAQW